MSDGIRHILFATDGSEYSDGAQRLALALAKGCGARLTAMTMVLTTEDLEGVGTHHLREGLEAEARGRLDTIVEAARGEGVVCGAEIVYGADAAHEIVAMAEEWAADLIVLGRRGRRGLARLIMGDATAKVAGNAPCNVLVVPRQAPMWHHRVLVATDGSPFGDLAVETALAVAIQCGLPVTVVSVTQRSHSAERKAEAHTAVDRALARMGGAGIVADGEIPEGRPDEAIVARAAARHADLIVLGGHGRTGLSRLLLGTTCERVIGQALCPILVARRPG